MAYSEKAGYTSDGRLIVTVRWSARAAAREAAERAAMLSKDPDACDLEAVDPTVLADLVQRAILLGATEQRAWRVGGRSGKELALLWSIKHLPFHCSILEHAYLAGRRQVRSAFARESMDKRREEYYAEALQPGHRSDRHESQAAINRYSRDRVRPPLDAATLGKPGTRGPRPQEEYDF